MRFRFWGVRGSTPCPLSPEALKAKVSSIVQRISVADLVTAQARERFLAGLPPELFGHVGGNTTCFEVEGAETDIIIVDAGTGIRDLGLYHESLNGQARHYHILFSHFHWDHIQGLPFFSGFFRPQNSVTFYSPVEDFESILRQQMAHPYFPVALSAYPAKIRFVLLGSEPITIAGTKISWRPVNHPGDCLGYRFLRNDQSLVFSTDTELRVQDFIREPKNLGFFHGCNALVLDAQYTLAEAVDRPDWGHTSASLAVDFGLDFQVKTLYLFHHEPSHDDAFLEEIGRVSQWYANLKSPGSLSVRLAREGRWETLS